MIYCNLTEGGLYLYQSIFGGYSFNFPDETGVEVQLRTVIQPTTPAAMKYLDELIEQGVDVPPSTKEKLSKTYFDECFRGKSHLPPGPLN